MKITQTRDNDHLTIAVAGEIEAVNADELEQSVLGSLDGVNDLTLDLKDLEYIASSGLRILFLLLRAMKPKGTDVIIRNNSDMLKSLFDSTGFTPLFKFE